MGMAYYVGSLPASEIKDGHVHLTVEDGTGIVTTIHVYRTFIERERERLDRFDQENGAQADIVKLTERGPMFLVERRT